MTTSRGIAGGATLVLALGLGACGGDDEPEVAEPTGSTVTVTETVTEEPTESEPPTEDETTDAATTDATGTATATTQEPGTAEPTETGEDGDLPAYGTEPVEQAGSGDPDALPTTVRFGEHDGYDRVVFDFEGSGVPGYRAEYVDEAVQDGSGLVVEVDGDAILRVRMDGVRYPEQGEAYDGGPGVYDPGASEVVEQVRLEGTFEGVALAFIGIDDEDRGFRVFTLTDPVRLVVDVATE
jgi:hypothetical protein